MLKLPFCARLIGRHPDTGKQCSTKLNYDLVQPDITALTGKVSNALFNFQSISSHRCQWLIHIGDECAGLQARLMRDTVDTGSQGACLIHIAHKCAVTHLDIHHQGIKARSEFLGKYRRRNQRNRFNRRAHISYGIKTTIGRGQCRCLADDGTTRGLDNLS